MKKGPTLERLGKPKPEAEDESDGKDEGEKQRLEEVTAFKQDRCWGLDLELCLQESRFSQVV